MPQISPHAIVECAANLADDVVVGPFTYIGPHVRIGAGTRVDNNVTLDGRVSIGRDNHIHPFAVIGQPACGGSPEGHAIIGDRNNIREHVAVCPGPAGTRIGSDNLIMIGCFIGRDARVDDQTILGNYTQLGDGSIVEKYVRASGFSGTRADVTIGAYTFTSGYAGVDRDAPPFAMIQGFPFKVRGVNSQNLKRCGFSEQAIGALKDAFRLLYNGSNGEADPEQLDRLAGRADLDEHLRYLVGFLRRPPRRRADREPDTSAGRSFEKEG